MRLYDQSPLEELDTQVREKLTYINEESTRLGQKAAKGVLITMFLLFILTQVLPKKIMMIPILVVIICILSKINNRVHHQMRIETLRNYEELLALVANTPIDPGEKCKRYFAIACLFCDYLNTFSLYETDELMITIMRSIEKQIADSSCAQEEPSLFKSLRVEILQDRGGISIPYSRALRKYFPGIPSASVYRWACSHALPEVMAFSPRHTS